MQSRINFASVIEMEDSESLDRRLDQLLASSKKLKSSLCNLSQDFCVLRDQVDSIDEKER